MAENCNRGVNNRNSNGCKTLQKRLQMIDFALADTILYLDAYPECSQALEYYHILLEQKDEVANAIIM